MTRALGAGEDYELLFTVRDESKLARVREKSEVSMTRVGVITEGHGVVIERRDGAMDELPRSRPGHGWDHFASPGEASP